MADRDGVLNWLAFTFVVLVWGSTFLFIRISNEEGYEPFAAALMRLVLAAGLLLGLAAGRGIPFPRGRDLAVTAAAGVLLFGVNFALLYWGELTVPSGVAAVLWASFPVMVILGAGVILRATEPLRLPVLGGALLAAGGLVAIFWSRLRVDVSGWGLVAILGGIAAAASSELLMKRHGGNVHPLAFNGIGALIGVLCLAPLAYAWGDGVALPPTPRAWLALAYLVVMGSVGAFVTYFWLLQRWTATRLSFQTVLSPIIAVILGFVVLGEHVGPGFLAGTGLVLLGTWLAVRRVHHHH